MATRTKRLLCSAWHATEGVYDVLRFEVLDTPPGWGLMGGLCTFVFLKLALGL